MLKATTMFLESKNQNKLTQIGIAEFGGLKTSGMTRLAVAEFIRNHPCPGIEQPKRARRAVKQSVLGA